MPTRPSPSDVATAVQRARSLLSATVSPPRADVVAALAELGSIRRLATRTNATEEAARLESRLDALADSL